MIYLILAQFLILLAIILYLYFKQKNKLLRTEGIPVSLPFPYQDLNLMEETNYIICLSTNCPHCRKIIRDLQDIEFEANNVFTVFNEDYNTVINYLNQYDTLKFEYLSDITTQSLYIEATPFVYILNENGIIIDKMLIKDIKYLNIV